MKKIGILVCFLMMFLLSSCSLISPISIRNKCENHLKEHLEEAENDRTLKIEMTTIYQLDNEYGCILTVVLGENKFDVKFIVDEEGTVFCEYCQNYEGSFLSDFNNIHVNGKKIYQRS